MTSSSRSPKTSRQPTRQALVMAHLPLLVPQYTVTFRPRRQSPRLFRRLTCTCTDTTKVSPQSFSPIGLKRNSPRKRVRFRHGSGQEYSRSNYSYLYERYHTESVCGRARVEWRAGTAPVACQPAPQQCPQACH